MKSLKNSKFPVAQNIVGANLVIVHRFESIPNQTLSMH